MWTNKNRGRYDRSKLRYPSDLTDDEWKLVEPLIPPGKPGGGKRTVIMHEVVNGLMYVLSTGKDISAFKSVEFAIAPPVGTGAGFGIGQFDNIGNAKYI